MSLERELAVYHEHLPTWLAEGRKTWWVCVYGDEVLGYYLGREAACSAGHERALADRAGTGKHERCFLVKQITDEPEPVRFFSRNIAGQQEARDARVRAEEREACARLCEELAGQAEADYQRWRWAQLRHRAEAYRKVARLIRERKE